MANKDPMVKAEYHRRYQERQKLICCTADFVRSRLDYVESTGHFHWKSTGKRAGGLDKDGYMRIRIAGGNRLVHHLVWLLYTGKLPECELDHADVCRSNNRITNLRPCSRRENIANSRIRANNTSGAKGVYWCTQIRKWKARIRINGKTEYLGSSLDLAVAAKAYRDAAVRTYGPFARFEG